ncbi:hypothetical protein AAZX31_07G190000 [Glycine max]|eukprot:XP_025985105.1 mediator of RNA polymerase II transcription subunit 25-like [Glycine max]
MTTNKWLNIVVDGNSALGPYWPKIVSDYLEKIVRSFFGNSRGEGVNSSCEVALIMYNFNPRFGSKVQHINWTKNVEQFLGVLPNLPFNGDNLNQHTIVEGLAQALVMFPKDSMTKSEYLKGERHCILVATGDPVAKSMLVNLPLLHKGIFISGQFKTLDATFINVAKIFVPLRVSLSIITPNPHPLFISIFSLGNGLIEGTDLITDHGKGQLTVLLSRNFKEAQCIHSRTTLEEDPLTRLLEQEQPMPLDEILGQVFRSSTSTSREGSLPQNAWSTEVGASSFGFPNTLGNSLNQFQPPSFPILYPYDNVSDGVGPSASAGSSVDVRASAAALVAVGAASSGAIADAGVVACANVGASPYYGSYHQQFPSHHRFEMSEINPIGTSSTGANPWGSPVPMMPEYNEAFLWPEPPTNFEDYVQAWEGCLVGRIHSSISLNQAKTLRRLTSSITLTYQWPSRLEIVLFLPKTAVSYTTRFYNGRIDHVFFQVNQCNNLHLYQHLMTNNLCAKIVLPFHTLILSTTNIMHQYLGLIFQGDI